MTRVEIQGSETIAKAIDHATPPGYRLQEEGPKPVIDPLRHIIDAWLDEGRRQRHRLQRLGWTRRKHPQEF